MRWYYSLLKQDKTNSACATDVEQTIIWLASNPVNEIAEIMSCSKSTTNASGSSKRNDTDGVWRDGVYCVWRMVYTYIHAMMQEKCCVLFLRVHLREARNEPNTPSREFSLTKATGAYSTFRLD